jgi:hypothetical protein
VTVLIAFDHALIPSRRFDSDGRMRVAGAALSRVGVVEYFGSTIPGRLRLNLAADQVYRVYRSGEELAKAAPSFRYVPVLSEHVARDAPFDPRLVVGTVGSDVMFDGEFLRGTVTIWSAPAIRGIEDGSKRELSAGYAYSEPPTMTAGTFRGQSYDCAQKNLVAHHVALVDEGKCGRSCSL